MFRTYAQPYMLADTYTEIVITKSAATGATTQSLLDNAREYLRRPHGPTGNALNAITLSVRGLRDA